MRELASAPWHFFSRFLVEKMFKNGPEMGVRIDANQNIFSQKMIWKIHEYDPESHTHELQADIKDMYDHYP